MRRVLVALAVLTVPTIGIVAGADAASTRTVVAKNIDFRPAVVRIAKGDTVRWLFRDGVTPHNVTSRGARRFRSSADRQTGAHSVRFTRSGTYRYLCTIHPNMVGRIIVG